MTNILVQEITLSGLSEPKTITLTERPTYDRIRLKLREVLQTNDVILLNKELIDNIDFTMFSTTTFKYFRGSVHHTEADSILCRNGAILSVKHESIGQIAEAEAGHEELSSEECTKLLNRIPKIEDTKPVAKDDVAALPAVERVLRDKSASAQKTKGHHSKKVAKPLKVNHTYADYGTGGQSLSLEFNQPVQSCDLQVKATPELPAGKWRWISATRVSYSGSRFPGSTEYKLLLGPVVLEDGTKEIIKDPISFSTSLVQIDGVYVENTKSPLIMIVFNQRINTKIPMFCTNVAMIPYAPTEDIKTLYKTASIITAYERAVENEMTVSFFKPEKWPISGRELELVINSGSHSAEGPLPTRGIKHTAYVVSPFTIRAMQWVQVPFNCVLGFQLSHPLHPDCLANIKQYVTSDTTINSIMVTGDRIYVDVPHKPIEFSITFDKSLMTDAGIILGEDFKRNYKKYKGLMCVPTSSQKITNVDKPAFQLIVSALTTSYGVYDAVYDNRLVPITKEKLGAGEVKLQDSPHEMQIATVDLEKYFTPTRKLVAVIVETQGTFFVQKTDWMVDSFAHQHGVELSVYTKDLKPLNNPIFSYMDNDKLVTVKDKSCLPANVTTFKVEANGDSAVFTLPEATFEQGNKHTIDWYTTTDRGLYQPGERAHVVGFARDASGALPKGKLSCVVKDGHNVEIVKKNLEQDGPSFDIGFEIPSFAHPGKGEVCFFYNGEESHRMSLPIKEFRIPDNEVLISSAQDNSSLTVETEVKSFIGDDVTGASTKGNFVVKNDTLTLPQYPGFRFYTPHDHSLVAEPLAKITNDLGSSSRIRSSFTVKNASSLVSIEYKPETRLKNGERLDGSHTAVFRPRGLAVGININREQVFSAAFPFSFEAIVIDENNTAVDGANVFFEFWSKSHQAIQLVKEFVKPVRRGESISVSLQSGEYIIQANVSDNNGNVTSTRSEVFNISNDVSPKFPVKVTLKKDEYAANETAKVTVSNLPAFFNRGLCHVYVKGRELLKLSKPLENNDDFTIEIPLNGTLAPKAAVYCSIIGFGISIEGSQTQLNLVGSATLNVKFDKDIKFSMNVSKHLGPTEKSQVTCDFERPLSEDVKLTVWAVDDAVLKLAKYILESPHEYFTNKKLQYKANASLEVPYTNQQRGWTGMKVIYVVSLTGKSYNFQWTKDTTLANLKSMITELTGIPGDQIRLIHFGKQLSEDNETLEQMGVLPGAKVYMVLRLRGDGGGGGSVSAADATPITVRKSNGPLAFFKAVSVPKGSKSTSVQFEAPTDLKRFKVFALAIGLSVYSKQESVFNVTKPFSITALVLKHLCLGDRASFPVTLYNRQDTDVNFKVAARTTSLDVTGARGFSGTIKANSSTSVEFMLRAAEYRDGAIQVVAVSKANGAVENNDAIEYPIKLNTLTVRRSVYGKFGEHNTRAHLIDINEHILGSGEININISPSILSQGVDALTYLGDYRYMCSEQISSQVLVSLQYLTLGSFVHEAGQKSTNEIKESIVNSIKALQLRHNGGGKFSYWGTSGDTYKHVNIQVAHALALAKKEGFHVDDSLLYQCQENLKGIIEEDNTATANMAYAAYILQLMQHPMKNLANKLRTVGKNAKSTVALAFLASIPETNLITTLSKRIGKDITAAANEESSYWSTLPKLYSLTILALLENKNKDGELMSQAVQALLRSRVNGHWWNTQSNMWSLAALAQYHQKAEKQFGENFKVKAWLGNTYLGEMTSGSTALKLRFDESFGLKALSQVTLQLTGAPVWYSVQLKLDSRVGEKPAFERFHIKRRLYGIEDENDVQTEQKNGRTTYRIKHGAYVGVEVVVEDNCYDPIRFFAVQDPVAAGLEPIEVHKIERRFRHSKWSHIDIRRDGVDAFADDFFYRSQHAYKALALRKGTYSMPSCHVEEMYNVENFSDSETATVIIE
jgi:uncharacterized protein YfaS (alpha-2-macroglobulin family)